MALVYYPAFLYRQNVDYGVTFPDLPGCVTVGSTMEHAAQRAREALSLHLDGLLRDGEILPAATPLDRLESDPEFPELARLLVEAELPGKSVRVNVSIEEGLLAAIDKAASARQTTRSGLIADAARRLLATG